MGMLRFLGLLFMLISIFAGSAAVVAMGIVAVRFWPLMLVILTTLAVFQLASKRVQVSRR